MARNFYVVLGVSRDADLSQIREAHRRLVRIHHPDTGTGSAERFTEVQQAYETLSDASSRRLYDETLHDLQERASRLYLVKGPCSEGYPSVAKCLCGLRFRI